jgi:hypothetical protein
MSQSKGKCWNPNNGLHFISVLFHWALSFVDEVKKFTNITKILKRIEQHILDIYAGKQLS